MAGEDFIIAEGLHGGEQVIVNGVQKARPGSMVKAVPWNANAPILITSPTALNTSPAVAAPIKK